MFAPLIRTRSAWIFLCLLLLLGVACKRPETALRERPAQQVELVLKIAEITPEEKQAMAAQIAEDLGLETKIPDPPASPIRFFRLTLEGGPDPFAEWGFGKTWLGTTGSGMAVGALIGSGSPYFFTSWEWTAIGAGVGTLVGFGWGPKFYKDNQALKQRLGYLPWRFTATWEVMERSPQKGEDLVARRRQVHLDIRSHAPPLPLDQRSVADVRRASLRAYADALVERIRSAERDRK